MAEMDMGPKTSLKPSWTPPAPSATPAGTCSSASKLEAIERRLEVMERTLININYHLQQSLHPAPATAPQPDLGHLQEPPQVPSW